VIFSLLFFKDGAKETQFSWLSKKIYFLKFMKIIRLIIGLCLFTVVSKDIIVAQVPIRGSSPNERQFDAQDIAYLNLLTGAKLTSERNKMIWMKPVDRRNYVNSMLQSQRNIQNNANKTAAYKANWEKYRDASVAKFLHSHPISR